MRRLAAALSMMGALSGRAPLHAQDGGTPPRTVEVARLLRDTAEQRVRIDFGVGDLRVGAAPAPYLYQMRYVSRATGVHALHTYDSVARTLHLGVDTQNIRLTHRSGNEPHTDLDVRLTAAAPIDLTARLAAARATLALGGLTLTRASVDAVVSALEVPFGSREWSSDVDLRLATILCGVTITVPADVGVRVDLTGPGRFRGAGFTKRGATYYSDNWSAARHRLQVSAQAVLSRVAVERTGP